MKEGSFLDDLDELNLGIRWRETLASSISFTLLSRCGADMDLWKDDMNFEYIHEFNNTKSLAVIGNATTEMCKPNACFQGILPKIMQYKKRLGSILEAMKKRLKKDLQMHQKQIIML